MSLFHSLISFAGKPAITLLSTIFFVTPLLAAIVTLFPIVKWPEIPAWPPIFTKSPISVLPAIPTCAAIIACFPIETLWAIWTKLSICENSPILVFSNTALSIAVLDPIVQFFSIITFPIWIIFFLVFSSKPKPE